MEIIGNKALRFKPQNPSRVSEFIPKSKVVGDEAIVHWGLDECMVLKNMGVSDVPSPINKDYKWHGIYKPFNHQKETAGFLTLHKRAYCLNEMGCVDSETEYLSPIGWVKIADYAGGEVAQYHPDSREIEFVEPLEFIKKPCVEMIHFSSEGVDQLLSMEHRMLIYAQDGSYDVMPAALAATYADFNLLQGKYIWDSEKMIPFTPKARKAMSTDGFKYCFSVPSTFLLFRRNGCVFASGNTGKSASVLWAADYLMEKGYVKRALIVCPLSIMHSAWKADAFRTIMHRSVGIAHGTKDVRESVIKGHSEIVVINYDGICSVMDAIDRADFDLIVIDEYNHYKNAQTRRWKAMNKLVKANTWLWGLTGSPASQLPTDAYGLAKLMNPSSVPKFYNAFRDDVMLKVTQFKYVPRQNAMDMVFKVLQPAIRYTKEECLDLPPRMYITREVPMSAQQKKYYKLLKEQMIIEAAGEEISAANAAVNLSKLIQISGGSVYADNKEVIEFDCSSRQEALLDIIEEASKKVIVFATFRHSISMLEDLMKRNNISVGVIHGQVSLTKRSALVEEFQSTSEPRVLILQPRSASHGITLTAANVVVWWTPTPSVETYLQANDRVHRAGQDAPCTVIHLCGSPVEERFYKTLEHKGNLLDGLLGLYKDVLTL